jgi:predicted adenylyl cyclase CyaB
LARNLELKIKLEDPAGIASKLKEHGGRFVKTLDQKDVYYEYDKGLLKLRIENGEASLIKYNRDETGTKRWSDYEILNLSGNSPEDFLKDILNVQAEVVKERNLYMYKDTRIHLDKVENLGDFLELESVVKEDQAKAEEEFYELVDMLELDLEDQIKTSYRFLVKPVE